MQNVKEALNHFTQRYMDLWYSTTGELPQSELYTGIPSPCIVKSERGTLYWQPIATSQHSFDIVEEVIQININPITTDFYCSQYAGDMRAQFDNMKISLIQVWSEDDFRQIEQNIIAHLDMLRRKKMRPNVFIATTQDESELIAIDNLTGSVTLENLHHKTSTLLSENLTDFLNLLSPIAD